MTSINEFLATYPYIDLPHQWLGWFGLVLLAGLVIWGTLHTIKNSPLPDNRQWLLFGIFAIFTPVFALIIGVRLPGAGALPLPNIPGETSAPVLLPLAALPWVLAGGIIGTLPAVLLGMISGLLLALWGTHTLFTPVEIAGLALLFSLAIRQPYRTRFFRFVRRPFGAALVLCGVYLPVFILSAFFSANGSLAARLDYALTQTWLSIIARLIELLAAGLLAEVLFVVRPREWPHPGFLKPSPAESSLQTRFLAGSIPLFAVFFLVLMVGDWWMAGSAARQMIQGRMESTAKIAVEGMPYLLETGQSLAASAARPELLKLAPDELNVQLGEQLRSVPFFRQLFVFDAVGEPVGGYPIQSIDLLRLDEQERVGIDLALNGVGAQTYTIPPWPGESTAQVVFLTAIRDASGRTQGVLLARTDLESNPFTQPAIQALLSINEERGEAVILDENGHILYHTIPDSTLIMNRYAGMMPDEASFYDEVSSTGTRQLVYYQPVSGRPWSVVLSIPAERAQDLALGIAIPLLLILLVFAIVATAVLSIGLRSITAYLQKLSWQATLISQGQLDSVLAVQGEDEAGRLARAFETMRLGLKARLEELNRLLKVSQGVTANLEIGQSLEPLMQAALDDQAAAVRVVLIPEVGMDLQGSKRITFGVGPKAADYAHLDGQVFDLMRKEKVVPIPNLRRLRRLTRQPEKDHPGALIAFALISEKIYYGTLWIAYDTPRSFSVEHVRFLTTLASEAAMAAANARLYATAEIGRKRLEAVLASTPDPVLVIDEQDRLLLLNPAAVQVPALLSHTTAGVPLSKAIEPLELRALLAAPDQNRISSREINMPNNQVFYASVSPVLVDEHAVGKVCILRDITHFKELDALKSEFVATVSHDLRSPLTLMRGYATMLQMVGELNEQQKAYVTKIVSGIEGMSQLVSNLLDLGRIEAGIGLQTERINPQDVIDQVVHALQPRATQKNIQLVYEADCENGGTIEADPVLLRQAIYNLVENALKFTRVNGQVNVGLQWRYDSVIVEVTDSGIGIAPLDLPRIFEKFYRSGQREANQQRGTGLGLAIVKSIAERHKGRVWVESQLGRGSHFYLEVPFQPVVKQIV